MREKKEEFGRKLTSGKERESEKEKKKKNTATLCLVFYDGWSVVVRPESTPALKQRKKGGRRSVCLPWATDLVYASFNGRRVRERYLTDGVCSAVSERDSIAGFIKAGS